MLLHQMTLGCRRMMNDAAHADSIIRVMMVTVVPPPLFTRHQLRVLPPTATTHLGLLCSSFSSSVNGTKTTTTTTNKNTAAPDKKSSPKKQQTSTSRKRQRHWFRRSTGNDVQDLPSLADFQRQVAVRNLYRKFWRLTYCGVSDPDELRRQIRREFRVSTSTNKDAWHVQRALSEGTRRYKELEAMLSTTPTTTTTTRMVVSQSSNDDTRGEESDEASPPQVVATSTHPWPWQQGNDTDGDDRDVLPRKPLPFPSKLDGS